MHIVALVIEMIIRLVVRVHQPVTPCDLDLGFPTLKVIFSLYAWRCMSV